MAFRDVLILSSLACAACSHGSTVSVAARPVIGTATMADDRTIVLHLVRDSAGNAVHARLEYRPGSPHYAEVLAHLGGLDPGGSKLVVAWPD